MEWNSFKKLPSKGFGWFCVATVPRNHSGSPLKDKCDLKGDNEWREDFGFTKAWLNNGRWYDHGVSNKSTVDITEYVTHWAECPKVPELTESHIQEKEKWNMYDREHRESLMKLAMEQWEKDQKTNPNAVNPHAYSYGFYSAFALMGVR